MFNKYKGFIMMGFKHEVEKNRSVRTELENLNELRATGVAKVIDFKPEYVSCITCDVCCGGTKGLPIFCQQYSCEINPREIYKNMKRAASCKYWFPYVIGRRASGPEYDCDNECWYEKDSMA